MHVDCTHIHIMKVKVKVMPGKKLRNEQQLMTAEAGGNQWNPNIISNCWVITDKEEDSGYEIIWGGAELLGETGKYVNELMCTKPSYDYTEIQLPLAITVLGNRGVKWVYVWIRVFMRLINRRREGKGFNMAAVKALVHSGSVHPSTWLVLHACPWHWCPWDRIIKLLKKWKMLLGWITFLKETIFFLHLSVKNDVRLRTMEAIKTNKRAICKCCKKSQVV